MLWIQIHLIWIRIQDLGPIWIRIRGFVNNFDKKSDPDPQHWIRQHFGYFCNIGIMNTKLIKYVIIRKISNKIITEYNIEAYLLAQTVGGLVRIHRHVQHLQHINKGHLIAQWAAPSHTGATGSRILVSDVLTSAGHSRQLW